MPAPEHLRLSAGKAIRKRKVAKVVGSDDENEASTQDTSKGESKDEANQRKSKKTEAIKLSFGDEE